MVRTKVFVGNLSFATKENELAKEFEASGKVISANIITRGPRSLGYGFVEMDNEADAENAVKMLNKKEIDGRPINVEVAKPREEGAEDRNNNNDSPNGGRGRGRGRGSRGGSRGAPRGGFRGGDSGNQGGFRRFRRRDGSEEDSNGGNNGGNDNGERGRGGRGRGGSRGTRGGRGGARPRRDERPQEERTPSQTTLFVANLPFSLEDDGFGKILKDGNLAFKTAHVVKKRSGRSKGFGFVEFENEGDQQKALAALNNKNVEGRELVVKVALTENREQEQEGENTTTTTTAPSTSEKKDEKPVADAKQTTPKTEKK